MKAGTIPDGYAPCVFGNRVRACLGDGMTMLVVMRPPLRDLGLASEG